MGTATPREPQPHRAIMMKIVYVAALIVAAFAQQELERKIPASSKDDTFVQIQDGFTLSMVSEKAGLALDELKALNPSVSETNLVVGEYLKIIEGTDKASKAAPAPASLWPKCAAWAPCPTPTATPSSSPLPASSA